jgi:hypothetical protein
MPVERRWYKFTRESIEKIPEDEIGAYLLGNRSKTPIRTGSSVNLRSRLKSHFISNQYPTTRYYKFVYADSITEARQVERDAFHKYLRKHPRMREKVIRTPKEQDYPRYLTY